MRWHCPPDTGFVNSSPSGLRPSTLPLGLDAAHNIESLPVSGEETFWFFETWMPKWGSSPRSPTFQAGIFNHCTSAPARSIKVPHPLPIGLPLPRGAIGPRDIHYNFKGYLQLFQTNLPKNGMSSTQHRKGGALQRDPSRHTTLYQCWFIVG